MPDPIGPPPPPAPVLELEPIVITGNISKPESPPLPIGAIALNCFDEAAAAAVVLLTRSVPSPPVTALAAAGIGFGLAACIENTANTETQKATIARALATCTSLGGTATRNLDETVTCAIPRLTTGTE